MRDQKQPYAYLPGGRIKLNETAQQALIRELQEEIGIQAQIERPLWVTQAFFTEPVSYTHLDVYKRQGLLSV